MSLADDQAGLITDFGRLAHDGSGDPVLDACGTLMALKPVALAVAGGIPGPVAARTLLETVAKDHATNQVVWAAAALTGIDPPDTRRGVRKERGPLERQRAAGERLGGRSDRTMRQPRQRERCYREFANVVLSFMRTLTGDQARMRRFLIQCGVSDEDAMRLTRPTLQAQAPGAPASPPVLAGRVRDALDAARASCVANRRAFYTPDVLAAILDIPGGQVMACAEEVHAGLGQRLRTELLTRVHSLNLERPHPFRPFEWIERQEIRAAQTLAIADGSPVITEVHLLAAILAGDSTTRSDLVALLGSSYQRLQAAANAHRHAEASVLKTPRARPGAAVAT